MKRAILFDLDGVLIDSMSCHAKAWQEAIKAQLNINVPETYFLVNEGRNAKDIVFDLIQTYRIDTDERIWQRVSEFCDQIFLEAFTPRLVVGAREIVITLHSYGYRLGIATGSTRLVLKDMLSKTGLLEYFSAFITAEDVEYSKPNPQPYRKLLNQLETQPEYALVIENAPLGIDSALAADLICLAVATTNHPAVLSHATRTFLNLAEIENFLENEFSLTGGIGEWDMGAFKKVTHAP